MRWILWLISAGPAKAGAAVANLASSPDLIESLPFDTALTQYDRPTTFFYCDPPYVGVDLYQHNFSDEQFEELRRQLLALKGRFLLSINDCPKARAWFEGFHRMEIAFTYTSLRTPGPFQELLFANYPLPDTLPKP